MDKSKQNKSKQAKSKANTALQLVVNQERAAVPASKGPKRHAPLSSQNFVQEFKEQLITPLAGSGSFNCLPISLNPGDAGTFKRLAKLSSTYTFYRFKKFRCWYNPEGSAFAGDNQKGEVGIGFIQDWYHSLPTSMATLRDRLPSEVGRAWEPLYLDVPANLLNTWRYIRDAPGTAGADPRMFDFVVEFAAAATPNSNYIGYLMIEGIVELRQAYVADGGNGSVVVQNKLNTWACTAPQSVTSGVAAALSMSSYTTISNVLGHGATLNASAPVSFTLYPGTYVYRCHVEVAGTTLTQLTLAMPAVAGVGYQTLPVVQRGLASATNEDADFEAVITVPETSTSGLTGFSPNITLTGTGPLTVQNIIFTIIQFG